MAQIERKSLQELREMYRAEMADEAITAISDWRLANTDEPCNEEEYLAKCLANGDALNARIEEALQGVMPT